jgi:hypothetical protein
MFRKQSDLRKAGAIALAVGTSVGAAAAVLLGVRARRRRQAQWSADVSPELLQLETAVVDALADDDVAGSLPLEIEAIAPGIIELSGTVDSETEADRAVAVAQRVGGVRTVLNRMDLRRDIEHLADAQRRDGGPAGESRWLGIGVGTGRRRQSPATDPARRDDSVRMRTNSFDAERHGEAFEAQRPEPGAQQPRPEEL